MLVFLLSHQRSGSHLLKHALESPPRFGESNLVVPPEILTPGRDAYAEWQPWFYESFLRERLSGAANVGPAEIEAASKQYLPHLADLAEGKTALCDIKINQLFVGLGWYHEIGTPPPLLWDMIRHGKFIFLRRRNILRAVVSGLVAAATGVWHRQAGEGSEAPPRPILKADAESLLYWVRQTSSSLAIVSEWMDPYRANGSMLDVCYEDLTDPSTGECNGATFDRIADFMGLPHAEPWLATHAKTGAYRLPEVFDDFESIRAAFRDSSFAWMLEEAVEAPPATGAPESVETSRAPAYRRLLGRLVGD